MGVGLAVGDPDGSREGLDDGDVVGDLEGVAVGRFVGLTLGLLEGSKEGTVEGFSDGLLETLFFGRAVVFFGGSDGRPVRGGTSPETGTAVELSELLVSLSGYQEGLYPTVEFGSYFKILFLGVSQAKSAKRRVVERRQETCGD